MFVFLSATTTLHLILKIYYKLSTCLIFFKFLVSLILVTSYPQVDQTNPIQNIEDEPLLDSDSDTEPESQEKAIGKEQSLYDWMSRSPTSMASLNKKSNGSENVKQNGLLQGISKF